MPASTGRGWQGSVSAHVILCPYMHRLNRLNMALDLQSLFWLLCTAELNYSLAPQLPPPPHFGLIIYEGAYWSAKVDDISL
jgi:hypothetical protein